MEPKLSQETADAILNGFKERVGHGIGAEDYIDILANLLNSLVSEDKPKNLCSKCGTEKVEQRYGCPQHGHSMVRLACPKCEELDQKEGE